MKKKEEESDTNMNKTKDKAENPEAVVNNEEITKEEQKLSETSELEQELVKAKEKLSQAEDQYLRLLADYQNLQKRALQEKEELYKYAAQKTIEILLPALDTFDYARSTLKPSSNTEKIIEDFNLVFEMLLKCLKDIGLEPIEEVGVPFDPYYHEPLHQIITNELPDHTVMQVLKKGYTLNKKVIRPALVSVSTKEQGEGKSEEPPEPLTSA